jgi:hypothetical protein
MIVMFILKSFLYMKNKMYFRTTLNAFVSTCPFNCFGYVDLTSAYEDLDLFKQICHFELRN